MKKFTFLFLFILTAGALSAQLPFTYTYTGKPRFQILTTQASATLGIINVELFPNIAPRHTRNFDSLVSTGFYDSTAFHRVVPGFVIQGGDPNTRSGPVSTWGYGNPNQPMVNAEFSVARHLRGILSAARQAGNINSATSQFFICVAAAPNLNGQYSIYGRVTSGMNIVDNIVNTPTVTGTSRPVQKVSMFVSYIGSNDTVPNTPTLISIPNGSSQVDITQPVILKWNSVSDGIIYRVEVSTDSLFAPADSVAYMDTPGLQYALSGAGLSDFVTYYWRVRVNNGGHFSPYSPVWNFYTTGVPTGAPVLNNAGKPLRVFPNPGSGRFQFSNLDAGSTLEVLDITGRLIVETAVKENTVTIDLDGREKGVYTYRLTGSNQATRQGKLILK